MGLLLGHILKIALPGAIVVITGEVITDSQVNSTATAGIRFNSDGSLSKNVNQSYSQIDAGEWWSDEPETGIGASYDVRALSVGKTGVWTNAAAADDVYIQMNADREWNVQRTGAGFNQAIATFEIRLTGSGSALDSAVYDCKATFIFI